MAEGVEEPLLVTGKPTTVGEGEGVGAPVAVLAGVEGATSPLVDPAAGVESVFVEFESVSVEFEAVVVVAESVPDSDVDGGVVDGDAVDVEPGEDMPMFLIVNLPDALPLSPKRTTM